MLEMPTKELSFGVDGAGQVSALLARPRGAKVLYIFGHGAGAGMRHQFMDALSVALYRRKLATFRYQFPYMEAGRKFPDRPPRLLATVNAAVKTAAAAAPRLAMFAGGKSMGGRMTSLACSEAPLRRVRGLIFVGFPLHPSGKPGTTRAEHLTGVKLPMLFLQGPRDKLAEMDLVRPMAKSLGRRAKLHVVKGADHGFSVLKRSGRTDAEVMDELADTITSWTTARR